MEQIQTITEIGCPKCFRRNFGLARNGVVKVTCPGCGCILVSRKKSRRTTVIEIIEPEPGKKPVRKPAPKAAQAPKEGAEPCMAVPG